MLLSIPADLLLQLRSVQVANLVHLVSKVVQTASTLQRREGVLEHVALSCTDCCIMCPPGLYSFFITNLSFLVLDRGPKAKKRSEEASSISNGKNNSNGVNGQRLSPQEQQQQSGEERGLNLLAELSRVSDGPGGSSSSTLNTLNGTGNVSNHGFGDGSMQNQQHSTTRNGVARALEGTSSSSGNLTISPSHSLLSLPPMQLNSACHPGNTTTGGGYTLHQQQHNHTQEQSNLSNKNSGNNVSSANATVHTAFPSSLFPPESSDGQFAGISNPTRTSTSNSSRLLEGSHATNNGSTSSTANNLAGMKHPTMSSMMNDFVNGFVPTTRPQYINSSQHQQHQHYTSANSASSSVTLPNSQLFNLPPFNLDSANQHHPFANADGSLSSIAATPNDGSSHSGTTLPTHYSHHQHQQMKSSQSNLPHSGSSHALPVPVPSGVSAPLPPPISSDLAGEEDSSAAFAQSFYKAEGPGLGHFQTVLSREFNVRDGASPSGASGTTTATSSHAYAHYAAAGGTASSSAGGGTHSHFMGGSMGGVNGDPSSVPSDVGFSPAGSDVPLPPHMEKDLVALADLPSTQQQLFGVYWCFVHPQWPIGMSCAGNVSSKRMRAQFGSLSCFLFTASRQLLLSIVYRPTFGYEEAKEIPALYNAMLAIICRPDVSRQLQHVPGTLKKLPLASRLGEIYTKRAIGHLNLMEMASSLHKVQALFMLALFDIGQGNTSRGWMFCGMATRMAYDLSLHQPSKTYRHGPATPIVQQEQRRTIWCCYALDMSMSIFLGRPSMMKYSEIETPLPSHWESDEFSYWAEDAKAVIPDRLDAFVGVQARPVSTLVAYVKLCHILERTMGSVYKPKGGMARASSSAAEELNNALDGWLDEHAELFTRAESPGQCTTNIYHVLLVCTLPIPILLVYCETSGLTL